MTVRELIEILQTYPGDEPIYARDLANPDGHEIVGVAPFDLDVPRGEHWTLAVEFDTEK